MGIALGIGSNDGGGRITDRSACRRSSEYDFNYRHAAGPSRLVRGETATTEELCGVIAASADSTLVEAIV